MKVGDAVIFIGFRSTVVVGVSGVGLIIKVHEVRGEERFDVAWPNGTFGNRLYIESLEVISEMGS